MAITVDQLITAEQLLDNVPMAQTVDHELLDKVILSAQRVEIQNILGTNLYEALLKEAVENTISGKRKELIDKFIIPALYEYSYRRAVLHLNQRATDKGVVVQNDVSASQSDSKGVHHLRGSIKNDGDFHSNLAHRFICEYSGDFPEFTEWDQEGIQPQQDGYFSGIVFD